MKPKIVIVFLILALAISALAISKIAPYKKQPIEIYVPCGMLVPFQELIHSFEAQNTGLKIKPTFDTGSVLVRFILNKNKRPDIFVSTGNIEMKNLVEKGLIDTETIKSFGKFNLVLYTSTSNPVLMQNLNDLIKPEVKAIALADPRFNSVGNSAQKALKNAGIWNAIKDKVVFTDSPIQALTLVASGKAQAGIHYDTCPFDTAPEKIDVQTIKIIQKIPQGLYPDLSSQIGLLKDIKNKKRSEAFLNFIVANINVQTAGNKNIVKIEAYYPFNDEHKFIGNYLKTFEKKYPGKVSVRLVDFRASEGYDEWRKTGLSCGGVLINGKSEFELDTPQGKKILRFLRRLDAFWSREDFEKVIEKEVLDSAQK